jgi:hypothetical protein
MMMMLNNWHHHEISNMGNQMIPIVHLARCVKEDWIEDIDI